MSKASAYTLSRMLVLLGLDGRSVRVLFGILQLHLLLCTSLSAWQWEVQCKTEKGKGLLANSEKDFQVLLSPFRLQRREQLLQLCNRIQAGSDFLKLVAALSCLILSLGFRV